MTRLRQENPARRQYLAELRALIAGLIPMTSDCKSEVARFILRYPDSDAFVVLIGDSFSDPMPVHCLLRHRNGQRLADSNRICKQARDNTNAIDAIGDEPGLKSVASTIASPRSTISRAGG